MSSALAILDDSPLPETLARLYEALPDMALRIEVLSTPQKKRLRDAARPSLAAQKASRQHASLVCDKKVTWLQVVDEVREAAMLNLATLAMENEQTAGVTRLRRPLGNELVGKRVIKVVGAHAAPCRIGVSVSGCPF